MRLLVITQKVDKKDSNLGFFHVWLEKLAAQVEHLYVICLEKGENALPGNVTVLSLGKEKMKVLPSAVRKLLYWWKFRRHIRQYQNDYDAVFVHMNPEYIVLGGSFWHKHDKKVLLWYTHKSVSWWLRRAEKRVDKIFTASKESFRLPSKKLQVVGHGIPVEIFSEQHDKPFAENLCLLSVGRITPSKDLETVVKGVAEVKKYFPNVLLSVVGEPVTPSDQRHKEEIVRLGAALGLQLGVRGGQRHYEEMPRVYQRYHILVHTSRTGSMDKVVLEALASGRIVVTSSEAYASLADGELRGVLFHFTAGNSEELAKTIEKIYKDGILKTIPNERAIEYVRTHHNLDTLVGKIVAYFK